MLSDVSKCQSPKQGIGDRVQQHVGVGVTEQSRFVWDVNAAQDQSTLGDETVYVVAVTDTDIPHHSLFL